VRAEGSKLDDVMSDVRLQCFVEAAGFLSQGLAEEAYANFDCVLLEVRISNSMLLRLRHLVDTIGLPSVRHPWWNPDPSGSSHYQHSSLHRPSIHPYLASCDAQ